MENREKIIQLLENPLISGYGIEKCQMVDSILQIFKDIKTCSKRKTANGYF